MLGLVLRLKEMVSRVRARPPAASRARDAGAQDRFATPGLVPNRLNQSQALPASVANQCSFNTKDSSILVLTYEGGTIIAWPTIVKLAHAQQHFQGFIINYF